MWFIKKFSAIIITSIILIIIFLIFSYDIYFKSVNSDFQEIEIIEDYKNTSIYQNNLSGIKTIISDNEKSAYFALGYIHANDRLFQMDLKRRLVQGKLSEVFANSEFLKTDILFRNIALSEIAANTIKKLDNKTLEILKSYSDGVNEYIKRNKNNLSLGFVINDYFPENWTITNCIEIFNLWSLENSIGFKLDMLFANIATKIGLNNALNLLIDSSQFSQTIEEDKVNETNSDKNYFQNIKDTSFYSTVFNNLSLLKNGNNCNLWIIKKSKTPLLAIDFHGEPILPSDWYQVHLKFNKLSLIGLTLPGYPFIISGRNNFVTWGINNSNIDNFDYFVEKKFASNLIIEANDTTKIKYIKDTIFIRNNDPIVKYKEKINDRYILQINPLDISYNNQKLSFKDKNYENLLNVTINWTGYKAFYESNSLLKISKAKTIYDIKNALNLWSCPNLNLICGDNSGNIALFNIGKIPVRNANNKMIIPAKRWDESYAWYNYGKEGINFSIVNPPENILISSNNQIKSDINSYYYDLPLRYNRIKSLLNDYLALKDYSYNNFDAQKMLFDNYSNYAELFLKQYKFIFQKFYNKLTKHEKKFINYLYSWNYINVYNRFEPALFDLLVKRLLINTFQDELNKKNFEILLNYPQIFYSKLINLSHQPYSYWWDDKSTNNFENRAYIVIKSLKEAISEGEKIYGTQNFKKWQYGKLHQMKLAHLYNKFSNYDLKDINLSISGDFSSLNKTHYNFLSKTMTIIPTMRMIIDISKEFINLSIPGGISEEPMSQYFKNQLNLWENGGYIKLYLDPNFKNTTKIVYFK